MSGIPPFLDRDSKRRFAEGNLAERFRYVDAHLSENDYVMGSRISVADGYLYNVLSWAPRVHVDLSGYPAILSFMARIEQRPSVRASLEAEGLRAA